MIVWQFTTIAVLIGALLIYVMVLTNRLGATNALLKRIEESLVRSQPATEKVPAGDDRVEVTQPMVVERRAREPVIGERTVMEPAPVRPAAVRSAAVRMPAVESEAAVEATPAVALVDAEEAEEALARDRRVSYLTVRDLKVMARSGRRSSDAPVGVSPLFNEVFGRKRVQAELAEPEPHLEAVDEPVVVSVESHQEVVEQLAAATYEIRDFLEATPTPDATFEQPDPVPDAIAPVAGESEPAAYAAQPVTSEPEFVANTAARVAPECEPIAYAAVPAAPEPELIANTAAGVALEYEPIAYAAEPAASEPEPIAHPFVPFARESEPTAYAVQPDTSEAYDANESSTLQPEPVAAERVAHAEPVVSESLPPPQCVASQPIAPNYQLSLPELAMPEHPVVPFRPAVAPEEAAVQHTAPPVVHTPEAPPAATPSPPAIEAANEDTSAGVSAVAPTQLDAAAREEKRKRDLLMHAYRRRRHR